MGKPRDGYTVLALTQTHLYTIARGKSPLRNRIAGGVGVLLGTVGIHLTTGAERFTFGSHALTSGIGFVPVLIGLFAVAELLNQSQAAAKTYERIKSVVVKLPTREDLRRIRGTILRSSGIGTFIGVLPAEGATVAAIMGYNEAKRWSKHQVTRRPGSIFPSGRFPARRVDRGKIEPGPF